MSNAKRYLDALFRTMASVARLFSARCWSNLEMIVDVARAQPPAQYQNVMSKRLGKLRNLRWFTPAKSFRRSG